MDGKLKRILAQLRRHFEELYGPRLVKMILYGSRARADAEPDSDIDALVVLKGPVEPGEEISRTGQIVSDLCLANNVVISRAFVSEERFREEQGPFLRNVLSEGIPV